MHALWLSGGSQVRRVAPESEDFTRGREDWQTSSEMMFESISFAKRLTVHHLVPSPTLWRMDCKSDLGLYFSKRERRREPTAAG